MDKHALEILKTNHVWKWPIAKRIQDQAGKLERVAPKFLYYLILESQKLNGTVLDHFWDQLGACNEKLNQNIESLRVEQFKSAERSLEVLFQGLDPQNLDFSPLLKMTAEYFTHLGVAFMNPGGQISEGGTAFSVSEFIDKGTDTLLEIVNQEGNFGKRKQEALKALSFKRDGKSCLLTNIGFTPLDDEGVSPILAHIIPKSVYGKPDTLQCIAMFAGTAARDDVVYHLNKIGNVMNMQQDAHTAYDDLKWGIEAKEEGDKVKYFFRMIPSVPNKSGPGFIRLREGDEIQFGRGPNSKELNKGPIPRLCNLRLAVVRVMRMSGAAEIIMDWKDEADDDGMSRLFIDSEGFCGMLDAKLFLTGLSL